MQSRMQSRIRPNLKCLTFEMPNSNYPQMAATPRTKNGAAEPHTAQSRMRRPGTTNGERQRQPLLERSLRKAYGCNRLQYYVSDLEEEEKTLLLYEGEGKLSRVRSKLIYRDFPRVRPCTGRDSTLVRKQIGLVL